MTETIRTTSEAIRLALILLHQEMRHRKSPNARVGGVWNPMATSLLDRLGADYLPEAVRIAEGYSMPISGVEVGEAGKTDKAEVESTRETANDEARDAFRGMFADTMDALDDLRLDEPGQTKTVPLSNWRATVGELNVITNDRNRLARQVKELEAERDSWQDKAITLQARLTRAEESCDRIAKECDRWKENWHAAISERDKWRERVDYLESECNRIQSYCDDLMEANIRLQNEKNKAAIERIEGVA